MSKKLENARRVIWEAFEKDPDWKRAYVDNVACVLMDNLPGLKRKKEKRDAVAEAVLDWIFQMVEPQDKKAEKSRSKDNIIAGALFDFAGYLTTRRRDGFKIGSRNDPTPILEALKTWAKTRKLNIDEAAIKDWHKSL